MNQISDEQLFQLFQNGDMRAFDQLMIRYKDRLYNFIYGIVNDVDLAEDLAQDTYLKVFTHKNSYKELYKFSTWMYTIAKNLAFTELRKKKRRKTSSFSDITKNEWEINVPDTKSNTIDEEIMSSEKRNIIQNALAQISLDFRIIIILRDIQELSYEDISKIIEVPIGTVKSRINRGREKLHQLLKGKGII